MSKPYHDEETLRELYYDEQLSTTEIGDKFDINPKTAVYWMDKHDIERRRPGKGKQISMLKESSEILSDKDRLTELYIEQEKTQGDIAELADVSQSTVCEWLERHGIETRQSKPDTPEEVYDEELLRELYYEKEMNTYEMGEYFGCSQFPILQAMDEYGIERRGKSESAKLGMSHQVPRLCKHGEALRYLYHEKRLNSVEIAKHVGCWPSVIVKWLRRHEIEVRSKGRGGGDGHVRDYGPDWAEKRKRALERDNYECRICGRTNEEQKEKFIGSLPVHHIKPKEWFRNDGEIDWGKANDLDNLISVCSECHPRCEAMAPLLPADVTV